MLNRWLLRPSETPPPSPILPDPRKADMPEKAQTMVFANLEVHKVTSSLKRFKMS